MNISTKPITPGDGEIKIEAPEQQSSGVQKSDLRSSANKVNSTTKNSIKENKDYKTNAIQRPKLDATHMKLDDIETGEVLSLQPLRGGEESQKLDSSEEISLEPSTEAKKSSLKDKVAEKLHLNDPKVRVAVTVAVIFALVIGAVALNCAAPGAGSLPLLFAIVAISAAMPVTAGVMGVGLLLQQLSQSEEKDDEKRVKDSEDKQLKENLSVKDQKIKQKEDEEIELTAKGKASPPTLERAERNDRKEIDNINRKIDERKELMKKKEEESLKINLLNKINKEITVKTKESESSSSGKDKDKEYISENTLKSSIADYFSLVGEKELTPEEVKIKNGIASNKIDDIDNLIAQTEKNLKLIEGEIASLNQYLSSHPPPPPTDMPPNPENLNAWRQEQGLPFVTSHPPPDLPPSGPDDLESWKRRQENEHQ